MTDSTAPTGDAGSRHAGPTAIESFQVEDRTFPPPAEVVAGALVTDDALYREAEADPEAFWARQARELLTWSQDFDTVVTQLQFVF